MPVGKGVISGGVAVMGSGQPARRARVTLSGSGEVGGSRSTTTDDNGRFVFQALPAGRFTLSASKPGHINATYGQRSPGRPGTPIQLGDGQKMDVRLTMARGGVITGTVVDEHGEAIPNTPVRVMRFVMPGGQRTLQQAGNDQTDDRGMYRIFGLQPGDYLVSATPRNNNQRTAIAEQQQVLRAMMLRAETVAQQNPAQAPQMLAERVAQLKATVSAAVEDDQGTGYAPVYYPGTTSPASASMVSVGAGEEKGGIDFQYQVVPIARVDGIVTSTTGQMPPNVQVMLVNSAFDVPGLNPGGTRVDQNGAFTIQNVPPGQYTLVARATINPGREGGPAGRGFPTPAGRGQMDAGGRGRGGPAVEPMRMWGTADVSVDGRNVSNIVVALQPGVAVSGRIVFDGATQQPPADLTRLRVTLQPVVAPGTSGEIAIAAAGRVDAEGKFTIASVVPGRYRLTASGAGNTWFLGSSIVDGLDSLDFPIEVKGSQSVSGAIVTFVDRQSEITGIVANERAQPIPDYTLVIYPTDARYRIPQSRRIASTRPSTDGRFTFRNLPAGDYRLAFVLDPEPGSWYDPAFLQQLDTVAVSVSIADGEKKEQSVRVPGGG
jgi:protocatechuate 3,4-dioxygenase beta subunit